MTSFVIPGIFCGLYFEKKDSKKPDEFPRENVGSARNLLPSDRETLGKTRRHNGLCRYFFLRSKRAYFELGGFTFPVAETTDEMSMESDFGRAEPDSENNLHHAAEKNKPIFLPFLSYSLL